MPSIRSTTWTRCFVLILATLSLGLAGCVSHTPMSALALHRHALGAKPQIGTAISATYSRPLTDNPASAAALASCEIGEPCPDGTVERQFFGSRLPEVGGAGHLTFGDSDVAGSLAAGLPFLGGIDVTMRLARGVTLTGAYTYPQTVAAYVLSSVHNTPNRTILVGPYVQRTLRMYQYEGYCVPPSTVWCDNTESKPSTRIGLRVMGMSHARNGRRGGLLLDGAVAYDVDFGGPVLSIGIGASR